MQPKETSQRASFFNIFFTRRFFISGICLAFAFVLFDLLGWPQSIPAIATAGLGLLTLTDAWVLFRQKRSVAVVRLMSDRFSNGDRNDVTLKLQSFYPFPVKLEVIEELPEQFQVRSPGWKLDLSAYGKAVRQYELRPVVRGVYAFGFTQVLIRSRLGLVIRRRSGAQPATVKVYPSYMAIRRYRIMATASQQADAGNLQMRKIGHSLEFEQIKDYVLGDDLRSINWKATARRGGLMVNHYVDERSQQVYCIIDKGRLMKMPFAGMTLLDYAINASLVLSHVCLQRQDRIGLITFSHKAGTALAASRNPAQMEQILESLYRQESDFLESDFERLYLRVRQLVAHRSLLILFTQFETMVGMRRQLPYLKQLARHHLLLVVFFENSELKELAQEPAPDLPGIYRKTVAARFMVEKKAMARELQQHGILTLLTTPAQLTVQSVNRYLDIKRRQAI